MSLHELTKNVEDNIFFLKSAVFKALVCVCAMQTNALDLQIKWKKQKIGAMPKQIWRKLYSTLLILLLASTNS